MVIYEPRFRAAFHANGAFQAAIQRDTKGFYARKFNQLAQSPENLELSRDFYLEELAVMSIQFEDHPGYQLYPGKELECLQVVRRGLLDVPAGLKNSEFCRQVVH